MELNFLLFRPPAKKWKVEELRGFHLWVPVEDSPALDKWIPKQNKAKFLPNIGDYLSAGDAKNSWDIEDQLESISIEEKNNIKGLIEQHSLDNSYNKPKFLKKKNSNNLIPAPQVLKVRMNFLGGVDANRNIHFYNKGSLTENELFSALENKYELNMIARGNFGYFPLSNLQKTIDDYHQLDESPHDESPYLRVDIEEEEWALSQAKSSRILEQWEIEESNVMVEDNSNSLLLGIEKLSSPPIKGLGNIKMEDNFQTDPLLSCNRAGEFSRRIPCLFIPEQRRNSNHFDKILVHFHGNAEDLMGIRDFATQLHTKLEVEPVLKDRSVFLLLNIQDMGSIKVKLRKNVFKMMQRSYFNML